MKPAVVILAAGASERLGECKALVELGGASPLERLIRAARFAAADEICVVAGAHTREIADELARLDPDRRVRLLPHPAWRSGRTGSLALAARELAGRALLLAPVDVPLVPGEVFELLFREWARAGDPARGWLAPCVEPGPRHGHPLVLGRELAGELAAADPDGPLRGLRSRAAPLWAVGVHDEAILDDLDSPADLARLRERLARTR